MTGHQWNKPIGLPAPRRENRRGWASTQTLHSALARDSHDPVAPVRSDEERRASYRRLAQRRRIPNRAAAIGAVGFALVLVAVYLELTGVLP